MCRLHLELEIYRQPVAEAGRRAGRGARTAGRIDQTARDVDGGDGVTALGARARAHVQDQKAAEVPQRTLALIDRGGWQRRRLLQRLGSLDLRLDLRVGLEEREGACVARHRMHGRIDETARRGGAEGVLDDELPCRHPT